MSLLDTLRFIVRHPLNTGRTFSALERYARWQIGSRLLPGKVAVPFVGESRLLVRSGMTGATGNIYTGLHEFEEMAFTLHFLRENDLFVDVGANVGAYTVLASAVRKAHTIAIEPVPETFAHLLDNININQIGPRVQALNSAVGRTEGTLVFTSSLDTVNHVLSPDESPGDLPVVTVPVLPLDAIIGTSCPSLMKIDVEGFETEVVGGARETMQNPSLLAVIMELNGSGLRYGFDENALHRTLLDLGFQPYSYAPLSRSFIPLVEMAHRSANYLYIRDLPRVQQGIVRAPTVVINGKNL